jgi:hypothetical protein
MLESVEAAGRRGNVSVLLLMLADLYAADGHDDDAREALRRARENRGLTTAGHRRHRSQAAPPGVADATRRQPRSHAHPTSWAKHAVMATTVQPRPRRGPSASSGWSWDGRGDVGPPCLPGSSDAGRRDDRMGPARARRPHRAAGGTAVVEVRATSLGVRALWCLAVGVAPVADGSLHANTWMTTGRPGTGITGLAAAVAGVTFVTLAILVPVVHRDKAPRRGCWLRRFLAPVAALVLVPLVALPWGSSIVQTHVMREAPPTRPIRPTATSSCSPRTASGSAAGTGRPPTARQSSWSRAPRVPAEPCSHTLRCSADTGTG